MIQSRDQFAETAVAYLRAQGERRAIAIDSERQRLIVGDPRELVSFINLKRAYSDYLTEPSGDAARLLQKRLWPNIRREAEIAKVDLLKTVMPRVRDRSWFAASRRQTALQIGTTDPRILDELLPPYELLNDQLGVHLAVELSTAIVDLGSDRLAHWGVTLQEALEQATRNLKQRSERPFELRSPGLLVSPWRDELDASRMMLVELFESLDVKGPPVVVAAANDTLFVTGSNDPEGLVALARATEAAMAQNNAQSGVAFILNEGVWQAWLPPREHPAWEKLKILALETYGAAQARQKQLLEMQLQQSNVDARVPMMRAFKTKSGDIVTAIAWIEGIPALLPRVDRIDFVRPSPSGKAEDAKIWSTRFELAESMLSELMQPIGEFPERFLVQAFPSDEQLEKLASEGALIDEPPHRS